MTVAPTPQSDEVEQLMLNAQLRDELEPYEDESIVCMNLRRLPTAVENDYLASMLAWERAPMLPIFEWFEPQMELPHPESLDDETLGVLLWDAIHKLFDLGIVLDFTDHLSDRALYTLILREILPSPEKRIGIPDQFLHWDCTRDRETWLRYYASEEERMQGASDPVDSLPPHDTPRHHREMPRRPL